MHAATPFPFSSCFKWLIWGAIEKTRQLKTGKTPGLFCGWQQPPLLSCLLLTQQVTDVSISFESKTWSRKKTYRGAEVRFHAFLSWALDEDEQLASPHANLTSEEELPLLIKEEAGCAPDDGWRGEERALLLSKGIDPWSPSSLASSLVTNLSNWTKWVKLVTKKGGNNAWIYISKTG
jgi:hypothetical protein